MMNSVFALEAEMRKMGHLAEWESFDQRLHIGTGCIQSYLINLDEFAHFLESGEEIDWLASLPELAPLYQYFNKKNVVFFEFNHTWFRGKQFQAERYIINRLPMKRKEVWIPATWARAIYKAYATGELTTGVDHKITLKAA